MSDVTLVFAIIAAVIALFVWDRLPVVLVCMGCAIALWATGLLTLQQSLAGFGDPATIFVASLFVASAAIDKTGVTAWVGQALMRGAGESRTRLIVLMILFVAPLSALISVNGGVAALLPVVVVLAVRLARPTSQMLMPLVFGGHAGSMLALTGTPVNVLVVEASLDAGFDGFGYFSFALVGVPLVLGVIAIAVLLGERLLPFRESRNLPPDLSGHARTLVEQFRLGDDLHQLRVRPDSPLAGTPRRGLSLPETSGLSLVTIRSDDADPAARLDALRPGDVLMVRGPGTAAATLAADWGLSPRDDDGRALTDTLFNRTSGLAEVLIPPRSRLVGERLFPGMVTESGDLIVLAVQRHGQDVAPHAPLAAGDTLLLQGTWAALDERLAPAEVLVVDSPDLVRRQALPMGPGAMQTLAILGIMVFLLATGLVPGVIAALLAAGTVLLFGILSVDELFRAINWTTVILVGAMMPLSTAIEQSGAASLLADWLVGTVGAAGPHALLAGLFVLTAVLGQVISNTATALIIIPVAMVAALDMGISPSPVLMSVAVASAAAFLTPVATPTNLMVMEPGNYRFGDYWKFGLPMMIWFFVIAVWLVPVFWAF